MAPNDDTEETAPEANAGITEQEAVPVFGEVDDSRSGRFRPPDQPPTVLGVHSVDLGVFVEEKFGVSGMKEPPRPRWQPGIVEVEFTEADIPSRMLTKYGSSGGSAEGAGDWPEPLRQLLQKYGYIRWARTFPISYSSPKEGAEESPRAKAKALDRDRFITFFFSEDAEVPVIAAEFGELAIVAHAASVPGLAPASPFTEPFTGTNDQVNPNHFCTPQGCFQNQWYLFRCGVDKAWQSVPEGVSGRDIVIADIDWGFSPNHVDLRERIELKHNTIRDDNANPADDEIVSDGKGIAHGTAVLGLAGAAANGFGMVGVAFESTLWAIQAGNDVTKDHKYWVEAIDFVCDEVSNGRRKIIILEIQTETLGNIEQSLRINKAIKDAIDANVVVCVPAGNGGDFADLDDNGNLIPWTGSILVGATMFNADSAINARAESNFGERVVVYAPGDVKNDLTCRPDVTNRGYRHDFGGTSGATAKVAGVVALMLQVNKELETKDIRDILRQTGTPITNDPSNSGVFLDARAAVCEALRRAGGEC